MTTSAERDRLFYRLKTVARHSATYGFFDAVGKLGTLVLVPLYTRILGPRDYGQLELFAITYALLLVLVVLGFNSGLTRYAVTATEDEERAGFVHSAFTFVLVTAAGTVAVLLLAAPAVARLIHGDAGLAGGWRLLVLTVFLDALSAILLALFRSQEKPFRYSTVNLLKLAVSLTLNLVFVAGLGLGVSGVLLANAIGAGAGLALALVLARRALGLRLVRPGLDRLLRFSLPQVPNGVALFALNSADRYFLKAYAPPESLGVYALAYKVGMVMSLAVSAFVVAWPPILLQAVRDPTGRETFAKVLTYYAVATAFVFVAVASYAGEIVGVVGTAEFGRAAGLVGYILCSYLLYGVFFFFTAGPVLRERTWEISIAVGAALAVNLTLNFVLIPPFFERGAALATVVSFAVLALVMAGIGQRTYPVPIPWRPLLTVTGLSAALLAVNLGLLRSGSGLFAAAKAVVVLAYLPGLVLFGVLAPEERHRLRALVARNRGRGRNG